MSKPIVEEASHGWQETPRGWEEPPRGWGAAPGWARIEGLHEALLLCQSATAVLETWCAQAMPADRTSAISVRRVAAPERHATPEQRRRLDVLADEAIAYREVQLLFEGHVLSEASNWYVPGRLSLAMNDLLESSTIPFGHVVAALAPSRHTIASRRFFDPGSDRPGTDRPGSDRPGSDQSQSASIPRILFEHRAVLYARGAPLAEVEEHYTSALLRFTAETGVLPRRDDPSYGADEGSAACLDVR